MYITKDVGKREKKCMNRRRALAITGSFFCTTGTLEFKSR